MLTSLLKVIKRSNRKLNRLRKRKPSQLPRSRFNNRRKKSKKRKRLLRNKKNLLPLKRPMRKSSKLLKKLPRMPLLKMRTKSDI